VKAIGVLALVACGGHVRHRQCRRTRDRADTGMIDVVIVGDATMRSSATAS
jgi:hypothetical protein